MRVAIEQADHGLHWTVFGDGLRLGSVSTTNSDGKRGYRATRFDPPKRTDLGLWEDQQTAVDVVVTSWTGTMHAYDYEQQQWTKGAEAVELRRQQLRADLDLVTGPEGADYLRFTGSTETPESAAALIRARLAELPAEAAGEGG